MLHTTRRALVLTVLLFAAPFAYAQDTTVDVQAETGASITLPSLPTRPLDIIRERAQQVRQNAEHVQQAIQNRVDTARDRAASTTARMQLKAAVRIHAGLITQRFQLALRHFDNLLARIESRMEKLGASGIATASAEAQLELARAANVKAKADIQAVTDFIASVEDSQDRAAVKTELHAKVRVAQQSIREAHQALMKTVRSLTTTARTSADVNTGTTTATDVQ